MEWKAHIEQEYNGIVRRQARLLVYRRRGDGKTDVLTVGHPTFTTVDEGIATPTDAGIWLPVQSVSAIAEAIRRFDGEVTDHEAEARLLREWMEHERGRVDRILGVTR